MTYNESINNLLGLEKIGIKLGLDNITLFLSRLGNPQQNLKFIHIAGTNGKGSVCSILAKALEYAGFKVGLQTSPHLISLRERFRINGRGISEEIFAGIAAEIWPEILKMYSEGNKLTFFEASIALSIVFFAREKCDFVIWETGLGGRLDATNVVIPVITAITTIDYDHQIYLGDTLEKIAFEKAGIIKDSVPLFTGNIPSAPMSVINNFAKIKKAVQFHFDENCLEFVKLPTGKGWNFSLKNATAEKFILPLEGSAQPDNMKQAFAILRYMSDKFNFNLTKALKGLERLRWPGRNQILPDGRLLDGAHNPHGIKALSATLGKLYPGRKFDIIYGCMEERPPDVAISILLPFADSFNFVPIVSTRSCFSPEKAAAIAAGICSDKAVPCRAFNSLAEALNAVKPEKNLITGSLYLAGDVLKVYYREDDIINI